METKRHATKQTVGKQGNQKKIKNYLETNEHGNPAMPDLWDGAKAVLRQVHNGRNLSQQIRKKIPNKQSNFTTKVLEKRNKQNPK